MRRPEGLPAVLRTSRCAFVLTSSRPRQLAEPTLPAAGIEYVFVNGRSVWSEGKPTGERPGRVLRRQLMQAATNS